MFVQNIILETKQIHAIHFPRLSLVFFRDVYILKLDQQSSWLLKSSLTTAVIKQPKGVSKINLTFGACSLYASRLRAYVHFYDRKLQQIQCTRNKYNK